MESQATAWPQGLSHPVCMVGFSERQSGGWAPGPTWPAPETQEPLLEAFLETLSHCSNDGHAMPVWAIPPTLPTPKVCSLVEVYIGLLQLVNTPTGYGGVQVAHSAAQHSFHDLHEVRGFHLIIHHTNLCTTTTLPFLEAAGQGQTLPERIWQSGLPQHTSLIPQIVHPTSFLLPLNSQRLGESIPLSWHLGGTTTLMSGLSLHL